jgi:pimeloyl-ACP methyl ester carboxylesterase
MSSRDNVMNLNFKELGQGPPLIMLHGLFGSSDNWLGVAPKLAQHRRVFLVDLRNHGLSPHSDDMSFDLMSFDLAEFLDARHVDRAHVLGHSLGGKVAMQFALTQPARVDRLIIVDIAPRKYEPEHVPIFQALLALDLKQYQSRTEIEAGLQAAIPDLALRRFLLKNLKSRPAAPKPGEGGAPSYTWRIPLSAIFANYSKLCEELTSAKQFQGPTLFLRGGQSPYVSDADTPQIRQLFPSATIETIVSARHWVHADAPDEFVKHVSTFLTR